jgi:protein YIPF1/2
MSTSLYYIFHWYLKRQDVTFFVLLCIYGYSLTIFIPIALLWMIRIYWFQWILTIGSSLISGSILVITLWPTIQSDRTSSTILSVILVVLAHFMMATCMMLVFFRTSYSRLNLVDVTQQ